MLPSDVTIAGTVVLYYPPDNLISNIESYIQFVDALYVIDNSEQPDPAIECKLIRFPKIVYQANNRNLGIATALNIGAKMAIEQGYTWLLTMDQDSRFTDNAFFDCFRYIYDLSTVAIISPYHFDIDPQNSQDLYKYKELDIVMTSGNLLNLLLYQKLGGFNDKLFIDEVDHDYCLNAKVNGYRIIIFPNIRLVHELGANKEVRWKGKQEVISVHSAKRVYYLTRNNFYLIKKYNRYYPQLMQTRFKNFLILCRNIVFFEEDKLPKMISILKGSIDFLRGKYGK